MQINTLNYEVMTELENILNNIDNDSVIKSIVLISGKPDCFIAGADITMLQGVKDIEDGYKLSSSCQQILNRIEKSQKPVVAAIQGSCLGGGLEVYKLKHYYIYIDFNVLKLFNF